MTTVRNETRRPAWLVLVRAPDPAGRLQGAAEAATATAAEGDGRPARAAGGDRQSGSHREHPGHLHRPAGRAGGGVSREGPLPGRAAGQEGPAALRHPAEHVRGQPPAGRGRHLAVPGPAAVDRIPADPLLQPDPAQRGRQVRRRELALPAGHRGGQPPLRRGPARPGQAQPGLHPGHRPVRRPDGSTAGGPRQPRRIGRSSTVLAQINQIDPIYVYFNISDLDLARLLKVTRGIPGPTDGRKWPVHAGAAQ